MAGLEECEGKLLLTLNRLKQLKEENPQIRKEIEVLERNVEDELLRLGWAMEQVASADCDDKEEEVVLFEDVADMTTMEDELEIDQVGPGSCSCQTLVDEDNHMEEPHDEVSTTDTCVSFELLVDGPYVGKGKISLPIRWSILPWMSTMRPCMEKQSPLPIAKIFQVVYDLMAEGENSHDKGRM